MDFKFINVGIADCKTASSPHILRTILGSCVGICIYDAKSKIGGLSHIMLPENKRKTGSPCKYADTAIPYVLAEMEKMGAKRDRMTAKITGGATMFKLSEKSMMSDIGKNNILKVRELLEKAGIKIVAEDVGGDYGRTIDFHMESGEIRIRSMGRKETKI